MRDRPRPGADTRLPRRVVLALPALAGVGAVAACGKNRQAPVVQATPTAGGGASATASAAVNGPVEVRGTLAGQEILLSVGPVVRTEHAGEELAILPIRAESAGSNTQAVSIGERLIGSLLSSVAEYKPLRLIDTAGSRLWSTTSLQGLFKPLQPGQGLDLRATFGPVDVDTVTVFLSGFGFAQVAVVDADADGAPRLDVDAIVAAANPHAPLRAPVPLERYAEALDGSSSGLTTDEETTVEVSSDITFDSDSAELSAAADAVLSGVAQTISEYDGGDLEIIGHTDDVGDDAHNQSLSEQRAQAVSSRLGELTDLGGWDVSVSGKGESEPKVTNDSDAHRQANRRVEIVITPAGGTDGSLSRSDGDTTLPDPAGPQGRGPGGVTVDAAEPDSGQVVVFLEQVTRRDGLLFGELKLEGGKGGSGTAMNLGWVNDPGDALANARGELGGLASVFSAGGLTLLSGSDRIYPVDYLLAGTTAHRALTELDLTEELGEGERMTVCVVWPDTAEDNVVVDHPGGSAEEGAVAYPWRLTDVPVVAG
ncbi:OmpA family protein [Actinomyces sp. 594]|uniref:OmpA family protein n=2 Tax=unclassified Actinomyces TaxID=2609248 RepID=UPI001C582F89|nr:OmpA family protein [Actinomyces sp. 594]MBW3069959.1 OmpA family protein [Actinomyces sp. 594]